LAIARIIILLVISVTAAHNSLADYRAYKITADNITQLPIGGMDAIGGVDDWLLSNGQLCAVISAPHHQTYLSLHGATLVDLWHCDRANDQWVTIHDQHNMDKMKIAVPQQV